MLLRNALKKSLCLLLCLLLCLSLPAMAEEDPSALLVDDSLEYTSRIDDLIAGLTLHEKVCQLFFLAPEQFSNNGRINAPGKSFYKAFTRFPVGGVILFSPNIVKSKIKSLNAGMQEAAAGVNGIGLLIGADEEGGSVSRVANKLKLPEKQPAPSLVVSEDQAYRSADAIGGYLSEYGFNVDFAPVADVRSEIPGAAIARRCYSDDPETVAAMVTRFVDGLHDRGIIPVLKHFPGLGAVSGDTHTGTGISEKTPEDWRRVDFIPFSAGIRASAEMVMVSHQVAVRVDPDTPASLSPSVIAFLREELGFEGVIITDALRMDAVKEKYGSGEACVLALEAGADMLLLPYNFTNAYHGVMEALESGRLTEKRLDESLRRILSLKEQYGLLTRKTEDPKYE